MGKFFHNLKFVSAYVVLCGSVLGAFVCGLGIPFAVFEPITFAVRWDSMWLVSELIGGFVVSVLSFTAAMTIIGRLEGDTTMVIPDDEDLC